MPSHRNHSGDSGLLAGTTTTNRSAPYGGTPQNLIPLSSPVYDPNNASNATLSTFTGSVEAREARDGARTRERRQTPLPGVGDAVAEFVTPGGKALGEVVVEVRNLTKWYKMAGKDGETVTALKRINLCDGEIGAFPPVRRGEFVVIRGPSGGGKTTLLNMIGTIDCPSSGCVTLLGTEITNKSDDDFLSDLRLRHLGFVFQTFNLIPTMTALENVELPMTLLGELDEKARRSRAKQLLGLVGLRNRIHHLPSELSGGEQQRVTIARALANNPAVLLLDEPTGDLDTATTIEVMDLLLNINNLAGTTMIMVTHNPDVECYADRILYVSDGEFAQQATNACPMPLVLAEYEAYLRRVENESTVNMVHTETGETVMGASLPTPLEAVRKQAAGESHSPSQSVDVDVVADVAANSAETSERTSSRRAASDYLGSTRSNQPTTGTTSSSVDKRALL